MTCDPTRVLRDEHRLILQVVDVLERVIHAEDATGALDDVADCVAFFRLYTDACHHGKEEDLLFESLVEHGFSRHDGPVAMMLQEHELGRALVRRMDAGIAGARDGDPGARADVRHAAQAYSDLLRHHIVKEDHALFEMADQVLADDACRQLCDAYAAVCGRRFEGRSLADLEALAARLVERYA